MSNLLVLRLAVKLDEDELYLYFAGWTFALLCNHYGYVGKENIQTYLIDYYQVVQSQINMIFQGDEMLHAERLLNSSVNRIKNVDASDCSKDFINVGSLIDSKKILLESLLRKDTREVCRCIEMLASVVPLQDLYLDVIQDILREVGELWHQNKISVAVEHYCTAVLQTAMAQFYEIVMQHPRCGKKVVIACPGEELHELGARMISDLLEHNGYDSIYLGASVPICDILDTIEKEQPNVCVLSVSMVQGLPDCLSAVKKIKSKFPKTCVAVGGIAFNNMQKVKEKTGADIYTYEFRDLLKKIQALAT